MILMGFAGDWMKRFVEGADRGQGTLFPECLDDWVDETNSVRVIDAFVDALNLAELGFEGVEPARRISSHWYAVAEGAESFASNVVTRSRPGRYWGS